MVKKIGFVRPTKTAGSELRMLFDWHLDMIPCASTPNDGGAPTHISLEEVYLPNTIWIGSVRNPYTRLYSIYNFFGGKDFKGETQSDWRTLDFVEFCTQLKHYKINSAFDDSFPLKSCFETLALNGKIGVDHIIRFEHLDEDLKKLSLALGLKSPLCMLPPGLAYIYTIPKGAPPPPNTIWIDEKSAIKCIGHLPIEYKRGRDNLFAKRVYKNQNSLEAYSPGNATFTRESLDIINEVYEQDFINFGYNMI